MKKAVWKKISAIMLAAAMAISLAACGSPDGDKGADEVSDSKDVQESAESGEEAAEGAHLTFQIGQSSSFKTALDAIAENAKNDIGIEVEYKIPPDTQGTSLFQTQLATGDVPDIAHLNIPNDYVRYNAEKHFVALDEEEWVERLSFDKEDITADDGHIYAMPYTGYSGVMGVIYNKQVFEAADVEIPGTYEEFLEACQKLSDAGVTPLYLSGKDDWTIQIVPMIFLANSLDEKADEVYSSLVTRDASLADIPEFRQALEDFRDLIDSGYVNADYAVGTFDESKQKVAEGEVAMIISGEYAVTDIMSNYPDSEIGLFPLPYADVDKFLTSKYVFGLCIPEDSQNVEAAKEFLNYMSQPKSMNIYLNVNTLNSPFVDVESDNLNPLLKEVYDTYFAEERLVPQIADTLEKFGSVNSDVFWQTYTSIAAGGDIDEAIGQLDAALEEHGEAAGLEAFQ